MRRRQESPFRQPWVVPWARWAWSPGGRLWLGPVAGIRALVPWALSAPQADPDQRLQPRCSGWTPESGRSCHGQACCDHSLDLLPSFRDMPRGFPAASSWVLSSDIRPCAGCASARRLMLLGLYSLAFRKLPLAFMVTTEAEALQGLATTQPGLLIATEQLEQGSGMVLVERARDVVRDIRTILILDGRHDDLVAAGRSSADAVLSELDCFGPESPIDTLIRSLAVGQRYRSASVLAAMEAAAVERQRRPWGDAAPAFSARERKHLALLVEGLSDRQIAAQLQIHYETARSNTKALRRRLGASSRAQAVAKALQLGLARLPPG